MSALIIELTHSEQWAAEQVGAALSGALNAAKAADEALRGAQKQVEEAKAGMQTAEAYRLSFVASVLKAHKKQDPGTPANLGPSDLGMRLTWADPEPPKEPTVHTPPPHPAPKATPPADASPAKKAAAGKKSKAKKKAGGSRG